MTNVYKSIYRALIAVRHALNRLIDSVRAKAYPESGGRRKKRDTDTTAPAVVPAKDLP